MTWLRFLTIYLFFFSLMIFMADRILAFKSFTHEPKLPGNSTLLTLPPSGLPPSLQLGLLPLGGEG